MFGSPAGNSSSSIVVRHQHAKYEWIGGFRKIKRRQCKCKSYYIDSP
jgi:hypothetical protein